MGEDRGRGGYAKGRERRQEILRVAGDHFAAHGYRGASVAQIAQRAGITDAGLLHHFPSKEHLLLEVLRERDDHDLERFRRLAEAHSSYVDTLLGLCAENAAAPGLVQLFTVMASESIEPDHPGHEVFRARYRRFRARGAELLREAQARGEIRADLDLDRLSPQVLAVLDGLQLQWLLDPDEVDMVATLRDFLQRLAPAPE